MEDEGLGEPWPHHSWGFVPPVIAACRCCSALSLRKMFRSFESRPEGKARLGLFRPNPPHAQHDMRHRGGGGRKTPAW